MPPTNTVCCCPLLLLLRGRYHKRLRLVIWPLVNPRAPRASRLVIGQWTKKRLGKVVWLLADQRAPQASHLVFSQSGLAIGQPGGDSFSLGASLVSGLWCSRTTAACCIVFVECGEAEGAGGMKGLLCSAFCWGSLYNERKKRHVTNRDDFFFSHLISRIVLQDFWKNKETLMSHTIRTWRKTWQTMKTFYFYFFMTPVSPIRVFFRLLTIFYFLFLQASAPIHIFTIFAPAPSSYS